MKPIRKALLAAALSVMTACQQKPATGPNYEGEALFTVQGALNLAGAASAPTRPIRLAVAWYPSATANSAPRAIVTQEVQYQGTFPLNYTFSFFGVPTADALTEYTADGTTVHAAYGVLMAYDDINGNGQLDPIASGGSMIDRILGTSLGDPYNGDPLAEPMHIVYLDAQAPQSWSAYGYQAGYNLFRSSTSVPASTPMPIPLSQTNELNFFVCQEFIQGDSYGYDLPCNIPPTDGVRVIGNVYRGDGVGAINLRITDGVQPITTAQVEVNGTPVAYANGLYSGSDVPVYAPGRNTVRVIANGQPARIYTMDAPADFALQTPLDGQRRLSGPAVDVSWTRAAGATMYRAAAYRVTPPYESTPVVNVMDFGQANLAASIAGVNADDYYRVQVVAYAANYLARSRGASMVNVTTLRSRYIDVIPANAGLRLEGSVMHYTYQGASVGSAWLTAFDATTELNAANVSVNGDALSYSSAYGMFSLETANVQPGDNAVLTISSPSHPTASTATVSLPGDFTVTPPAATHSSSQPLNVSWSASADATHYYVSVRDGQGATLHQATTLNTTLTVPALNVTGAVYVSIAAVKTGADRHLSGLVQKVFDVALTQ